ncbi:MAG: hypothetical protein WCE68_04375 [Anaerolineales bacterium]
MIEHSEINPLLEVIMSTFQTNEKAIALSRTQLNEHIGKLTYKFPQWFSCPELRQAIKVQS